MSLSSAHCPSCFIFFFLRKRKAPFFDTWVAFSPCLSSFIYIYISELQGCMYLFQSVFFSSLVVHAQQDEGSVANLFWYPCALVCLLFEMNSFCRREVEVVERFQHRYHLPQKEVTDFDQPAFCFHVDHLKCNNVQWWVASRVLLCFRPRLFAVVRGHFVLLPFPFLSLFLNNY